MKNMLLYMQIFQNMIERHHLPRSLILIILFLGLTAGAAYSGWSEDVRLTYRGYEMDPQVVARNDTVHVVWQQIAGPMHISYMRSTDGGNEWDSLINLEETGHIGARPDFSLFPGGMFVGWFDEDLSNFSTYIAYSYSQNGSVWHGPEYAFDTSISLYDLGTACYNDSIYVAHIPFERDSTLYSPIRFFYSPDMGNTWSNEITVGHLHDYANFLHIARCAGTIYIVWASDNPPIGAIHEVMAVVSHDGGQTWSNVMQLSSPDTAVAQHTCIACDEESGNFAVGWMDAGSWHHFPGDLYIRITTDGGYTWMPESHATYDRWVWDSSIAIKGDSLWAVWNDADFQTYGDGNAEICFSKTTDLGGSWSTYERLTYAPGFAHKPWISYDSGKLHVVWYEDDRPPDSTLDIYYKRFEPEVGIGNEPDGNLPNRIVLAAYPNPFNSTTIITYSNLKGGEIDIYNINGQIIRKLGTDTNKEGQIKWDARDASGKKVSSGIYFARVSAPRGAMTVKLLYLK
jgi:hypothetical protein